MLDNQSEKHHIYKLAYAKWGKQARIMEYMEEAAALTKELSKNLRTDNGVDKIAEKIAGVDIILEQLISIFECPTIVAEQKRHQLIRLRERVKV
jgi:hypothetical protein